MDILVSSQKKSFFIKFPHPEYIPITITEHLPIITFTEYIPIITLVEHLLIITLSMPMPENKPYI